MSNEAPKRPEVGQVVYVRGIACRIVAVLPMRTIDVTSLDGRQSFRLSGLYWAD